MHEPTRFYRDVYGTLRLVRQSEVIVFRSMVFLDGVCWYALT